mmetsp:Transcript_9164/g.15166  ORF Transcript_9164/g.15166 Transcript_9164/m.15166 type:complete len:323 (+) Transcript_9164:120-1088(+)
MYGILVRGQVKSGKWPELKVILNGHFTRQLDGREPGATCATIIEPGKETPDTWHLFEQFKSKADYDLHNAPNENLKLFLELAGPLLDGPPDIKQFVMQHFEKSARGGRKYGILVEGKVKPGKMSEMVTSLVGHLTRQHDGRELGATCATILEATSEEPDTLRIFEQWETEKDYEAHAKPNENLKVFMDAAGPLWDGDIDVKQYSMHHFERSLPGVCAPPVGAVEMKVTTKKSTGFYVKAACSFLRGVDATPAVDDKEAVEAKPAVDYLRISGVGDAVGVAITAAASVEAAGLGSVMKTQTAYPPMEGSGRGCAQIAIDLKKS